MNFIVHLICRVVFFWLPSVRVGDIRIKYDKSGDSFENKDTKIEVLSIKNGFTKYKILFPSGRSSLFLSTPTWLIFCDNPYLLRRASETDEGKHQVRDSEVS